MQAENGADRMDWINKITGAIALLLNSHILQQVYLNEAFYFFYNIMSKYEP